MKTVYPIGYSAPGAQERIDELLSFPQTLLIDTRIKPYSWNERWRKEALEQKYGDCYRWAGKYLGNENYQGGPIKLADPDKGIAGLMKYLSEQQDLVLLCQCQAYEKCHVSHIVTLLLEKLPEVEVVKASLSLGQCAMCDEPATHQSPSGRAEGLGCEKHSYCRRCKTSLDHFVKHSGGYVCPCVAASYEKRRLQQEMKQAKQATLF